MQVDRNLEGYLARHVVLIDIDASDYWAWNPGLLGLYSAWFPSTELPADFEQGFEPKPLEKRYVRPTSRFRG